jgi:hypothetical protein
MLPGTCLRGVPRLTEPASPNDRMDCPPSITGISELIRLAEGLIPAFAARHGMENGTRGAYADAAVHSGRRPWVVVAHV